MAPEKIADKIAITICGDGGCGKSSITLRLVRSQWVSDYDPTIEDSYSVTRTVDGLSYHLSLTDTAGQEEYRGLWASSNLQSDAFLLVYDITSANSLEGLLWFLDMIEVETDSRIEQNNRLLKERGTRVRGRTDQGWKAPPIMIIAGNKCDLNEARAVTSKTGWDFARNHGCGFMETSARDMVNIEETFAWMVRKVIEARKGEGSNNKQQQQQQHQQPPTSPRLSSGQYHRNSGQQGDQTYTQTPQQGNKNSQKQSSMHQNASSSQAGLKEKSHFENDHVPWYKQLFLSCFERKWQKKTTWQQKTWQRNQNVIP